MNSADDTITTIGSVALFVVALVGIVMMVAGACAIWGAEKLHGRRWLGPIVSGSILAVLVIQLVGCAAAPQPMQSNKDPEVWRPATAPAYPLPR